MTTRTTQYRNIGLPATWRTFGRYCVDVVELVDVDPPHALAGGADRHGGVGAAAERDHAAGRALERQVGRHHRVVRRHHQVERVRAARAHQVAELLVDDVLARALLDQRARELADAAELAVPVGVLLAGQHHLAAGERRALGDRHHRVVRRVRVLVRDQELAELVDVERDLGDHRAVDARRGTR